MTEFARSMLKKLSDPDKNVRGPAAIALGGACSADAMDALLRRVGHEPDFYVREDITWALVRYGELAVEPLIGLLRDPEPAVRHHAAHTLSKIGDPRAVEGLIDALPDAEATVAAKVVAALGSLADARAIPALIGQLGHADADVQTAVTHALEWLGDEAVPHVVAALKDERWPVREHAADTLGHLERAETVGPLIAVLADAHWRVRFAAVNALGHLGGAAARRALAEMPADADPRVQQLAARALRRLQVRARREERG